MFKKERKKGKKKFLLGFFCFRFEVGRAAVEVGVLNRISNMLMSAALSSQTNLHTLSLAVPEHQWL